jgi:hypothetical protein
LRLRLIELQGGNPRPLRVLGVQPDARESDELRLLNTFAAHRMKGEWFAPVTALTDYIRDNTQVWVREPYVNIIIAKPRRKRSPLWQHRLSLSVRRR